MPGDLAIRRLNLKAVVLRNTAFTLGEATF